MAASVRTLSVAGFLRGLRVGAGPGIWRLAAAGSQLTMWGLILANWWLHVIHPPQAWTAICLALAHAVLALQAACFVRCVATPPPPLPETWQAAADAGDVPAEVCKRSERLLPLRGRFVRRHGCVVLGFDHYCVYLGTPIGLHNRRYFIQFLGYSGLLCAIGCGMAVVDVLDKWSPKSLAAPGHGESAPATDGGGFERFVQLVTWMSPLFAPAMRYLGIGLNSPIAPTLALTLIDGVIGIGLLGFTVFHAVLVLRNATTLEPTDRSYDVGAARNWAQHFGQWRAAWLLPLQAEGAADGLQWPTATHRSATGVRYKGGHARIDDISE
eukprot:4932545-Prymnesium_polylepis.1